MSDKHDEPPAGAHRLWRVASLIWFVAGLLFHLALGSATVALATALQPFLSSSMGISDELLAYRVAITVVRVPLTTLLGVLVGIAQCAVMPVLRPVARRWLIASAVGAAVSTLVLLPSALVFIQITGSSSVEMLRMFTVLVGAALFGGFVSLLQKRAARGRLGLPAWFVVAVSGTTVGAFVALLTIPS